MPRAPIELRINKSSQFFFKMNIKNTTIAIATSITLNLLMVGCSNVRFVKPDMNAVFDDFVKDKAISQCNHNNQKNNNNSDYENCIKNVNKALEEAKEKKRREKESHWNITPDM